MLEETSDQNLTNHQKTRNRFYRKTKRNFTPKDNKTTPHKSKAFNPIPRSEEYNNKTYEETFSNEKQNLPQSPEYSDEQNKNAIYDIYKPFTLENNLYTYIRQMSGFNPIKFWNILNEILKEKSFESIRSERLCLLSYIIIYEKDLVYGELLEKFSDNITRDEFENSLFVLSLYKNPTFIKETIKYYNKLFSPHEEFQETLIKHMAKFSYRKENNEIILNWLSTFIKEEQIKTFWNLCIQEKNVVLFEQALNFSLFRSFLKNNYKHYQDDILGISKKHITEKSFINSSSKKEKKTQNEIIENTAQEKKDIKVIELEPIKNNNTEELSLEQCYLKCLDKKEKTTIITKKKRKII